MGAEATVKKKVVLINTHSLSSLFPQLNLMSDLETLPYKGGWHVLLAEQISKISNKYDLECWGMEARLGERFEFEREDITYRFFPSSHLGTATTNIGECSWPLLRHLKRVTRQQDTLIHLHTAFSWTTFLTPLIVKHVPLVVQHHGEKSNLQLFQDTSGIKRYFYLLFYLLKAQFLFERLALPRIDHFFVLNEATERYLGNLVSTEKIQRLTMGVDFTRFRKLDKTQARKALNLELNKKYILFVGSLVERKGLKYLVLAIPKILQPFPNTELMLIGEGSYKEALFDLVKDLRIEDHVRVMPQSNSDTRVRDAELPLYYNSADVFVLPSLIEGLGVVGIEAMACETPFVGTNVDGIPSLVDRFKAGTLIPPKDADSIAQAVINCLQKSGSIAIDREAARKAYDWPNIAQKTIRVYDTLFQQYGK